MSVAELIAALQQKDQKATVYIYADAEPYEVTTIETDSDNDVFLD